jgi:hypothetical protein
LAPVVTVAGPAKVALAPEAGAANVTDTPDTGFPPESLTTATSGFAKGWLIAAVWPLPLTTAMLAGEPAVLVRENDAGVETPVALAVTLYAPAMLFAVSAGEVAWPLAAVVTVAGPPNVALAPDAGAANVTLTPEIGLPPESVTSATSGELNAVFTGAL